MARGLSASLTTELANQSIKPVALVQIDFPSTVRLTNHYKDLIHNSNTYTASGHLLGISAKSESSEINVANFQLELSAVDNTYVSIVLNNVVSNDKVTVDLAFLDSTDAIIDTFNYDIGFIESFNIDTTKGTLLLNCTSHFADFSKISARKTNNGFLF